MSHTSRREDVQSTIRKLQRQGYTQLMLANEIGVSESCMFYWSKGTRKPPMLAVKKLKSMVVEVKK